MKTAGDSTASASTTTQKPIIKPAVREDFPTDEAFNKFMELKEKWIKFLEEASLYSEDTNDSMLYALIKLFQQVFYSQTMFQQHFNQM